MSHARRGPPRPRRSAARWPCTSPTPSGRSGRQVMSADPVDRPRCSRGSPATRRSPGRGPVTPTSSACRSTGSTRRGRSWSGPAPGRRRPGSRWVRSPRAFLAAGPRRRAGRARGRASGTVSGARRAPLPAAGGRRPPRRRPGALPRSRRQRRHGRRDRRRTSGRGHPRRRRRGASSTGSPPGLGCHVHWDRRLDSRLAGALMGIQAIKGVELGDGFGVAARRGSLAHDEIERGPRRRASAHRPRRAAPRAACPPASCCGCAPR